jgi:hypothetical protein
MPEQIKVTDSTTNNDRPRGLAAFDSLRAEDEPWLAHCYVPPTDFPLMAGWRSALIFGGVGSGKTALRMALERQWCPPGAKPRVLLTPWPVTIIQPSELRGMALVLEHVKHVMDAVARVLLYHLGRYPDDWGVAPLWAQNTLCWFVQRHFLGDVVNHVASLEHELTGDGVAVLSAVAAARVSDVLNSGTPTPLVIAELVRALHALGIEGVRVVVHGLEPWIAVDVERLATHLEQFLSALALFEHPRFAYYMFLPATLESSLWSAGSIARRRAVVYLLKWEHERLLAIVERRLSLALEGDFSLEQLGPAEALLRWLARCGGHVPRGWLEALSPFLATYLEQAHASGKKSCLSEEQLVSVQQRHPPPIHVELPMGQVTVGWREVEGLQTGQQALLSYLYEHRGQVCPREHVYRAYLEGTGGKKPDKEYSKDYAGTLDNAIYRLRQAIEPDPDHPVLVVTIRGLGFRLDNAW